MDHFLADIQLLLNLRDLVGAVAVDDKNVVDVGAGELEFSVLEAGADESSLLVEVEAFVGLGYFSGND